VRGSGCREAALELSLPFTLREGVPSRGGAGLETVAPGRIAGDSGLPGVLSLITTSLGMSAMCAVGLAVEVGVGD